MAFGNIRNTHLYAAVQSAHLTAATVATANYFTHSKVTMDRKTALIKDPSITGSLTEPLGILGKMTGDYSIDIPLRGSGTTLTAPPFDAILQSLFGSAISTGVYSMVDTPLPFSLYRYRLDDAGSADLTNQLGLGSIVTDATFVMGPDIAMLNVTGTSAFVLDNKTFSTYLTPWKGGLSSFPAEPTAPTSILEQPTIGFTGSMVVDSNTLITFKSANIKIATGKSQIDDTFGSYIGTGVYSNTRTVDITLELDEDNSSACNDLKTKAFGGLPINIAATIGTVAGNSFELALVGVQLDPGFKLTDGPKGNIRMSFASSIAHGSTLAGLDAVTLTCL